ncbi:MoaD/ThiS family protein [Cellulosilyticum sp. I15G10I2]|uniref:MoaD/ThiS family protein n=1 Tax=Cellulosilyticum sp. I15G10I2 TaxID=1892843 RepID=UPI00085C36F6|nr:MoaD/ThiS family protein [Cellulosilyticum sp. I15G10I2]
MQIKVRLFATLRQDRGKEVILDMKDEMSPQDIIDLLKIPKEDVAILLINGRDGALNAKLSAYDIVSIFPPVGGG